MIKNPVACLDDINLFRCRNPSFVRGAVSAVLEQYGLAPPDPGNEMRGARLEMIAETCGIKAGIDTRNIGPNRMFEVRALYTESDWPGVFNGIAQAALMAGWDSGPSTWQRFCGTVDVRSFRPQERVLVGGFGIFAKVPEGQSIEAQEIPGYAQRLKADRYGLGFGITEEALVNNDLSRLISSAHLAGAAGAASIESVFCTLLASNPNLLDGGALFNATAATNSGGHANRALVDSAISTTAIALGKGAMRRQTAPRVSRPLNIRPRFLLAAAEQEEEAWAVAGLPNGFGESGSDLERYMLQSGRVEVVTTPYLEGPAWYLAADPLVAALANVAFINGRMEPMLSSRKNFGNGGIDFVARLDFGVAPGDFRGGYKNAGP